MCQRRRQAGLSILRPLRPSTVSSEPGLSRHLRRNRTQVQPYTTSIAARLHPPPVTADCETPLVPTTRHVVASCVGTRHRLRGASCIRRIMLTSTSRRSSDPRRRCCCSSSAAASPAPTATSRRSKSCPRMLFPRTANRSAGRRFAEASVTAALRRPRRSGLVDKRRDAVDHDAARKGLVGPAGQVAVPEHGGRHPVGLVGRGRGVLAHRSVPSAVQHQ